MEHEPEIAQRLDRAVTLLERTLTWLAERAHTGDIERIAATIDPAAAAREEELATQLAAAQTEIAELRAAASAQGSSLTPAGQMLRKTVPASTAEMLIKHGIGDTPVDVRTLDAALSGLSLEQRIAVKSQLLRAGALA